MPTPYEKFLYTVHFMVESKVDALAKMLFEKLCKPDERDQVYDDWLAASRVEFRDLIERVSKIADSPIPSMEMRAMANRIWSGVDVPPESQS